MTISCMIVYFSYLVLLVSFIILYRTNKSLMLQLDRTIKLNKDLGNFNSELIDMVAKTRDSK